MAALDFSRLTLSLDGRDLLVLAWLLEQAVRGCDLDQAHAWAADLRNNASKFRAQAVDR